MRSAKGAAILAAGFTIGGYAGWTAQAVVERPNDGRSPSPAVASVPSATAPTSANASPAESLTPFFDPAAEHAARLAAEKERDALRAELAAVKSETASLGPLVERRNRSEKKLVPFSPPEVARRLGTIQGDVAEAIRGKDAKREVELLDDLARIGRPAFPIIQRMILDVMDQPGDGFEGSPLGNEFFTLLLDGDLHDLGMDALLSRGAYEDDFRKLIAEAGSSLSGVTPEEAGQLLALVGTEKDAGIVAGILQALGSSGSLDAPTLLQSAQAQPDKDARLAIVSALASLTGPDATAALATLAGSDPDASVQRSARMAILQRDPPVQGYLVQGVVPGSQAETVGLQEGDVITSYNGTDVSSTRQLAKLKSSVDAAASVPVTVWRSGALIPVTLRAGAIGVSGDVVTPGQH